MPQKSPSIGVLVLALALASFHGAIEAQAPNVTLTITTDGVVSGAVGVQGPGANVCNPNPGGGPGGGTCVFTYNVGAQLRIAANSPNPDPGFLHDGTGDANGCQHSTCNITLTTNSSIAVTFDASFGPVASYQFTLLGDGKGNIGIDNQQCQNFELGYSGCTTYYAAGSEVKLQGRSMPGNIFERFLEGVGDPSACGAASTCVFTATAGTGSVKATFSALTSVAVVPSAPSVNVNNNISLNASATFTNGMTRNGFGGNSNWFSHVPMDVARFSLAASVVNDRLYAIGGVDGTCPPGPCGFGPLATVEVFNPNVTAIMDFPQAWTPRASMLTPREGLASAVVDGKIYALGGHTTNGGPVSSMEYYDPSTNTWTVRASMPAARAGMAAAAINNTIYVVGGSNNVGGDPVIPEATVGAYDAGTDTWTTKAPMLTARAFPAAAAVNGTLYVIGGDATGSVEAYDPATNTWTARAPVPAGGGAFRAVALNGLIYAIGNGGAVKVYNPAIDSWATLNPNNAGSVTFNQIGLAVLDGRLFAAGGLSSGNTAVNTFSAFRPPETTWWSNNSAVGRINPGNFGSVFGVATGTAIISARLVGIDSGAQSATLTVTSGGGGGPSQIFLGLPNHAQTQVGNPGNQNWACGTFSQNNAPANSQYTVRVNFGDGTIVDNYPFTPNPPANSPCVGNFSPKGVFFLNLAYASPGPFHVSVRVTNTTTSQFTDGGFDVDVLPNNGGGGGNDDCAQVITNFTIIGSVPFNEFHVKFFDRATNELLFETDAPFVLPPDAAVPEGSYRIELSVPAGYSITPSIFSVDAVCGTPIHLDATIQAIPPTISLSLSPNVIWPPNNQMVTVSATIAASSPLGHATTVQLVSVTSDGGAGDIAGASIGTDDRAFEVRAKKDRTYTVTYRATDSVTGASATATATVVVPHDQGK